MPGRAVGTKGEWGYAVWVVAALVVVVPELTAAIWSRDTLGFITISETIGHLERYHPWVELGVIAVIVLVVYSLVRLPAKESGRAIPPATRGGAMRTTGGRFTFSPAPESVKPTQTFDDEPAPWYFAVAAIVALVAVALAGLAVSRWWDDPRRFHVSFVIYLSIAVLWFVVPNLFAVFGGHDVPFPTMARTIRNLEEWLMKRGWRWHLGPRLAWVVTFVVFWGLVTLMIHLLLYPFPDITHILNDEPVVH
jgi:hypothetical protein